MTRFALVLGASGGIGEVICKQLAEAGWSLYLHYNANKNQLDLLRSELEETYPNQQFRSVHADFRVEQAAEKLAASIQSVQAIVVANGQAVVKLLSDTSELEMSELWQVHMQNPARLIALLSEKLRSKMSPIYYLSAQYGAVRGLQVKSCILQSKVPNMPSSKHMQRNQLILVYGSMLLRQVGLTPE